MPDTTLNSLEARLDAIGDEAARRAVPLPEAVRAATARRRAPAVQARWALAGVGIAAAVALGVFVVSITRPTPRVPGPGPIAVAPVLPQRPTMAALNAAARTGDLSAIALPGGEVGGASLPPTRRGDILRPERLSVLLGLD